MNYTLQDSEAVHEESPETFYLPPIDERNNLKVGATVKLVFEIEHSQGYDVERMWVIVERIEAGGNWGILDNTLYCTDELKSGVTIQFQAKHVIAIYEK